MQHNSDIMPLVLDRRGNKAGKCLNKQLFRNNITVNTNITVSDYFAHCVLNRIHLDALPFIC